MATQNAVNVGLSGSTGSGSFVGSISATLVTPTLGVATATSINKLSITAPATSSTLTIADGKSLVVSNSLIFSGTDGASVNFGAGGTVAYSASSMVWYGISGTSQLASVDSGYVVQNAGQTTITLPATANLGDRVAVAGLGAEGWILTANSGQTVKVIGSTTSSGGTLTSTNQYDQIEVVCLVANTTWGARFVMSGGLTVA